jgi:hypothetical protein
VHHHRRWAGRRRPRNRDAQHRRQRATADRRAARLRGHVATALHRLTRPARPASTPAPTKPRPAPAPTSAKSASSAPRGCFSTAALGTAAPTICAAPSASSRRRPSTSRSRPARSRSASQLGVAPHPPGRAGSARPHHHTRYDGLRARCWERLTKATAGPTRTSCAVHAQHNDTAKPGRSLVIHDRPRGLRVDAALRGASVIMAIRERAARRQRALQQLDEALARLSRRSRGRAPRIPARPAARRGDSLARTLSKPVA